MRNPNGSFGRNRDCAIRSAEIDSDRAFHRHGATSVREERQDLPVPYFLTISLITAPIARKSSSPVGLRM